MTNPTQKPFQLTALVTTTALTLGAMGAGCGDTSARRIETGGPQSITSVDQIDDQDWAEAANKLVQSVIDQGVIAKRRDGKPTRIAVRKFVNNTSQMVDVDLLLKQVTIGLNKTGNVRSIVEDAESTMNTGQALAPDYRLSGKMIENRASAGRIKQSTYYFQMSLYDPSGENVWEDQVPITKAGSRNSAGF